MYFVCMIWQPITISIHAEQFNSFITHPKVPKYLLHTCLYNILSFYGSVPFKKKRNPYSLSVCLSAFISGMLRDIELIQTIYIYIDLRPHDFLKKRYLKKTAGLAL